MQIANQAAPTLLRRDGKPMTPRGIKNRDAAAVRRAIEASEALVDAVLHATDDRERAYVLALSLAHLAELGAVPDGDPRMMLRQTVSALMDAAFPNRARTAA